MGDWYLGDAGVLVCRCAEDFSAHKLALAAQRRWCDEDVARMAFAWMLELPPSALTGWQRYELSAVLGEALTARTLPGAVVVRPSDEVWMRGVALDLAMGQGGILGVFTSVEMARDWSRQQALAFIGESVWRVRELAGTLHKPVCLPQDL